MANVFDEMVLMGDADQQSEPSPQLNRIHQIRGWLSGVRFVKPAMLVAVSFMGGVAVHSATQSQVIAPTKVGPSPLSREEFKALMEDKIELTETVGPVGSDGKCGNIACGFESVCCRNDLHAYYCCAPLNFCSKNVCIAPPWAVAACFAGEASLEIEGHGAAAMKDVNIGNRVRMQKASGVHEFEPVLGFLHTTQVASAEMSDYLAAAHSY